MCPFVTQPIEKRLRVHLGSRYKGKVAGAPWSAFSARRRQERGVNERLGLVADTVCWGLLLLFLLLGSALAIVISAGG